MKCLTAKLVSVVNQHDLFMFFQGKPHAQSTHCEKETLCIVGPRWNDNLTVDYRGLDIPVYNYTTGRSFDSGSEARNEYADVAPP